MERFWRGVLVIAVLTSLVPLRPVPRSWAQVTVQPPGVAQPELASRLGSSDLEPGAGQSGTERAQIDLAPAAVITEG